MAAKLDELAATTSNDVSTTPLQSSSLTSVPLLTTPDPHLPQF